MLNGTMRKLYCSVVDSHGYIRFCWRESEKNLLLGSFFYGYVVLQIAGGSLAEKFGTKLVLALSVFLASVLSLLTPVVAKWNLTALIVLRIAQGLFEGVTYPSLPPMIKRCSGSDLTNKLLLLIHLFFCSGELL